MEVFTDLLKFVVSKFTPEWEIERASISEDFDKCRWISFDLRHGKGYSGIMDKVAKVYDAIIGESFGVVDIDVDDANSACPSVRFKVFDKEVADEGTETN